jgi:hypothetical protein
MEHILRLRRRAALEPQPDCLEAFAVQIRALAEVLPSSAVLQPLTRQLLTVAEDLQAPQILAACGDFGDGQPALLEALLGEAVPSGPAAEPPPSAAMLVVGEQGSWIACAETGARHVGTLQELQKRTADDRSRSAPLGRVLARLIFDASRNRSRDCLLLFVPGYTPAAEGSGDTALSLLRRAEALVWLTAAGSTEGSGDSNSPGQPIDLLVASGIESRHPGLRPGQTEAPHPCPQPQFAPPSGDGEPALVLLDVQERAGDLFRDSRLAQIRAAVLRLYASTALHACKLGNAISRTQEAAEALTRRLEDLANSVLRQLDEVHSQPASGCARKALLNAKIHCWEERSGGSCAWLGEEEGGVPKDEELLSGPLRQELDKLRAEFAALSRDRRSIEREQARNLEEQRFHERRLQDLRQDREQGAGQNLALQFLYGLLGKESEAASQELADAQALCEQCSAEKSELELATQAAARREEEIAAAAHQLAAKTAVHLRATGQKYALAAKLRRVLLRRLRWRLQANTGILAAAASIVCICATLEEIAVDLRQQAPAETPLPACILALRRCRRAADTLLRLRELAGNARMVRIYRHILALRRQTLEADVRDCGGVLRALDMALAQVPVEELSRELSHSASPTPGPLAQFAEGIAAWLVEPDLRAAQRARSALLRLHPSEQEMAELKDFIRRHAGHKGDAFLAALPVVPSQVRAVLRSAPRSSPAYHQAILRMGVELLQLFESARETE